MNIIPYYLALEDYQKAAKLLPDDSRTFNNLGLIYSELGQPKKALEAYNQAIALKKFDSPKALNNRGLLLMNLGQYEGAIHDFSPAIERKPENPIAYTNRGYVFELIGEKQHARKDYEKAFKLNPKYERAKRKLTQLNKKP